MKGMRHGASGQIHSSIGRMSQHERVIPVPLAETEPRLHCAHPCLAHGIGRGRSFMLEATTASNDDGHTERELVRNASTGIQTSCAHGHPPWRHAGRTSSRADAKPTLARPHHEHIPQREPHHNHMRGRCAVDTVSRACGVRAGAARATRACSWCACILAPRRCGHRAILSDDRRTICTRA